VIGEMTLSVTFSSTPTIFSGSATNFHDDKGAAMDGSLVFSGGEFDRSVDPNSDATLKMLSANGTLIDTNSRELVFASKFEGDFFGESVDAVGGAWLGDVTHGGKTQQITGTFIAEK